MQWTPRVTVAAVIEQDNRFLLVEENVDNRLVLNQPAGHWEFGESLLDAVRRETLEETAQLFEPQHLLGIYSWTLPGTQKTYLRFAFTGIITGTASQQQLDDEIEQTLWLTRDEIRANQTRHRSPLVWRCIEDLDTGKRYPLELLSPLNSATEHPA
ncbi:MAG: NUDIX hydrolase [Chromatiales bacterium]|jgi:ADP-ribose pyrophosphatase YjhB (NUDIX family)